MLRPTGIASGPAATAWEGVKSLAVEDERGVVFAVPVGGENGEPTLIGRAGRRQVDSKDWTWLNAGFNFLGGTFLREKKESPSSILPVYYFILLNA